MSQFRMKFNFLFNTRKFKFRSQTQDTILNKFEDFISDNFANVENSCGIFVILIMYRSIFT